MDKSTNFKIKKVLWHILEQHAFLLLDDFVQADDKNNITDDIYVCVFMSFICNNNKGYFKLILPKNVNKEIEDNIAGEQMLEEFFDGSKEMLNILGANIISELYGSESVVNLSIPEANQINFNELLSSLKDKNAVKLSINKQPVVLIMKIQE